MLLIRCGNWLSPSTAYLDTGSIPGRSMDISLPVLSQLRVIMALRRVLLHKCYEFSNLSPSLWLSVTSSHAIEKINYVFW